ncbi:MAG: hypothetical protein MR991_05720 [Clostridiales bacterium]|nr:hypothetical protein [Clostridiales bacterium]MDD7036105.1 hypothetical protein [Bacillota bacterium]MDY2920167.1 hypothetical protein [Lentihominibacter sp.]
MNKKFISGFRRGNKKGGGALVPLIIVGAVLLMVAAIVVNTQVLSKDDATSKSDKSNISEKQDVSKDGTEVKELEMWECFEQYNCLGDDYLSVSNKYESKLEYISDTEYGTIWQDYTYLGIPDLTELYRLKGTDITFSFGEFDEVWYCDCIGGTAEEIFAIHESTDIDEFMDEMGVYIGDQDRYSVCWTEDAFDNNWWALKAKVESPYINGTEYVYMIRVCSEGLKEMYGVNYDYENGPPLVDSSSIGDYYGGYGDDYNIVYPYTKVTVSLVQYGVGLY